MYPGSVTRVVKGLECAGAAEDDYLAGAMSPLSGYSSGEDGNFSRFSGGLPGASPEQVCQCAFRSFSFSQSPYPRSYVPVVVLPVRAG